MEIQEGEDLFLTFDGLYCIGHVFCNDTGTVQVCIIHTVQLQSVSQWCVCVQYVPAQK